MFSAAQFTQAEQLRAIQLSAKEREVGAAVSAGLDANRAFAADGWIWALECLGKATPAALIPARGVHAEDAGQLAPGLRFGRVPDPLDPKRQVFNFTAHNRDPRIWGAPRCEVIFSPTQKARLPTDAEFWFGFGLMLPGWMATQDEQIVAQWQIGNGTVAINPLFAISVQGDGLRFQARFNSSKQITKAGTSKPIDVMSAGLPVANWTYLVVKARISADPSAAPYLKVWRDGFEIISYTGPLGYDIPGFAPYAKIGHYHWIDSSNPWPETVSSRTVLIRHPSLILRDGNQFQALDVTSYIKKQ